MCFCKAHLSRTGRGSHGIRTVRVRVVGDLSLLVDLRDGIRGPLLPCWAPRTLGMVHEGGPPVRRRLAGPAGHLGAVRC